MRETGPGRRGKQLGQGRGTEARREDARVRSIGEERVGGWPLRARTGTPRTRDGRDDAPRAAGRTPLPHRATGASSRAGSSGVRGFRDADGSVFEGDVVVVLQLGS